MYRKAIDKGGLAVVTGAANGVGKAAAQQFIQDGLGVVLVDLEGEDLDRAEAELRDQAGASATVQAIPTDVTDTNAMTALADQVFALGDVAVLMNNAGIALPTGSWASPLPELPTSRSAPWCNRSGST